MGRLTDDDRHLGPLTYARSSWTAWRLIYSTGGGDEGDKFNSITLYLFGWIFRLRLPNIIPPYRQKVVAQYWDAATVQRMGRDWYWDEDPRQFGFSLHEGFLQIFHGRQSHDSTTDRTWCCHLPWTQWRHVRQSWYGPTGQHIETLWDTTSREVRAAQWEWRSEFVQTLAKTCFEVIDADGTRVVARTHIEEREWRFGTGLFQWLSLFRRPRIRRSLDIEFDTEVGSDKGSWKGGLVGTGIDMEPGELHEAAFRRFCSQQHRAKNGSFRLTFVGPVAAPAKG